MKAVRIKQGKYQVVECTPRKNKTDDITPLTDWKAWPNNDFTIAGIKSTTAKILNDYKGK